MNWIVEGIESGPSPCGCTSDVPEFVDPFKSAIWDAEKKVIMSVCTCAICNGPVTAVHHIFPRSMGGKNHIHNLIGLCDDCHYRVHQRLDKKIVDAIAYSINITRKEVR